jgi:tRNA (guanine9-N1)-methyltransferase
MMAEERPAKLRKFEHSALGEEQAGLDNHVLSEVPSRQRTVGAQGEHANYLKASNADATETNEPDSNESDSPASEDHEEPVTPGEHSTSALPLSKNALKKIRNKERWDASRDARKLKRKQKIAEKRIRKRAARQEAREPAGAGEGSRKGKKNTILQYNFKV